MLDAYVVGIIEQQSGEQVCRIIAHGARQECWFLMSLVGDMGNTDYFVLPETVYQRLPIYVNDS